MKIMATFLQVDSREEKVIPFFVKEIVVINNMKVGDYAIIHKDNDVDKVIHVFERKTMPDLCYSIINRNLHLDNMINLKEEGCDVAYIIEAKSVFYADETVVHGINYYKIRALLDAIYIDHKIPIIYTQSASHTAITLERYVDRYNKQIAKGKLCPKGGQMTLLSTKPEVTIEERVRKMWLAIPGFGENIVATLMGHYSLKELLTADMDHIRNIKINGKKIGSRIDASMADYQSGQNTTVHHKILSAVNGISETKTNRILATITFCDMTASNIASVTVNGKKIGKVGQRIIDYMNYKKVFAQEIHEGFERHLSFHNK